MNNPILTCITHVLPIVGTAGIILQAPTLYDTRPAIDEQLSEIEAAHISKPEAPPVDYPTVASF